MKFVFIRRFTDNTQNSLCSSKAISKEKRNTQITPSWPTNSSMLPGAVVEWLCVGMCSRMRTTSLHSLDASRQQQPLCPILSFMHSLSLSTVCTIHMHFGECNCEAHARPFKMLKTHTQMAFGHEVHFTMYIYVRIYCSPMRSNPEENLIFNIFCMRQSPKQGRKSVRHLMGNSWEILFVRSVWL